MNIGISLEIARPKVKAVVIDTDAQAALTARTTPALVPDTQRMNTLVVALKAASLWTSITGLWIGAVESAQAALINIKNPAQIGTVSGSPVFTAGQGYTVSSANYLNTGIAWNTLVTQNAALLGVYTTTDGVSSSGIVANAANSSVRATLRVSGTDLPGFRVNAAGGVVSSVPNYDARGLLVGQRVSSATVQYFKNGVQLGADAASTSTTAPSDNLVIGISASADTRLVNAVVVGANLTAQQNADLNSILRAYMASAGVYVDYWPAQAGLSVAATAQTPDIPIYSGAGVGFTITGLASLGGGNLLAGDDGRYADEDGVYDATNWRPKVHVITTAGVLTSSIDVYALDGSASTIQGVCVDANGNYRIARTTRNKIIRVSPGGALLDDIDFAIDGGPNGLTFDTLRGQILCAGTNTVDTIYKINPVTKTIVGNPIFLQPGCGVEPIDHLDYDAANDQIAITKGVNGVAGRILVIDMNGVPVKQYRMLTGLATEGLARVGSDYWTAQDMHFHKAGNNVLQRYAIP